VKKNGSADPSLVGQLAVAAARGPFIAKVHKLQFSEKLSMVLSWMFTGTITNAIRKVFKPRNGTQDHFKVDDVAAVPSGFSPHLTDQACRNNDTELRRKFAPCLFP
jgi:hypothetical protein